jgi:hypothetical protein
MWLEPLWSETVKRLEQGEHLIELRGEIGALDRLQNASMNRRVPEETYVGGQASVPLAISEHELENTAARSTWIRVLRVGFFIAVRDARPILVDVAAEIEAGLGRSAAPGV